MKDIGKSDDNIMPTEKIDEVAMEYVNTIKIITTDMNRFKLSTTQIT